MKKTMEKTMNITAEIKANALDFLALLVRNCQIACNPKVPGIPILKKTNTYDTRNLKELLRGLRILKS